MPKGQPALPDRAEVTNSIKQVNDKCWGMADTTPTRTGPQIFILGSQAPQSDREIIPNHSKCEISAGPYSAVFS